MTKARDLANASTALSAVSATELAFVDGVTSAIQTQMDGKIAKTLTTTTGDIIYASGANTPARLGIGSSAQVLTVASGIPSWAAPAAGGKVLQVVSANYSTIAIQNSNTYADTGLTATITPTLATSKILVLISQQMQKSNGNAGNAYYTRTLRGGTTILEHKDLLYTGTLIYNLSMYSVNILDNPATTSATTYKTQLANYVAAASVSAQENNSTSSMTLLEIGV